VLFNGITVGDVASWVDSLLVAYLLNFGAASFSRVEQTTHEERQLAYTFQVRIRAACGVCVLHKGCSAEAHALLPVGLCCWCRHRLPLHADRLMSDKCLWCCSEQIHGLALLVCWHLHVCYILAPTEASVADCICSPTGYTFPCMRSSMRRRRHNMHCQQTPAVRFPARATCRASTA
jgi:hypothetical protein